MGSRPFDIGGIDHVVLRSHDLKPMLHFYEETLGCSLERQVGDALFQLRAGRSLIDVVPTDDLPSSAASNLDHFALTIEPFNGKALRAYFERHGVKVVGSGIRYGAEGDGPSIYIEDPSGNLIELKGSGA